MRPCFTIIKQEKARCCWASLFCSYRVLLVLQNAVVRVTLKHKPSLSWKRRSNMHGIMKISNSSYYSMTRWVRSIITWVISIGPRGIILDMSTLFMSPVILHIKVFPNKESRKIKKFISNSSTRNLVYCSLFILKYPSGP